MKKFLVILCFIFICHSVQAENDKFIEALRNCYPYHGSAIININGVNTKSNKQMLGWQDNKCTYKETVSFGENKISTVCKFSKPQIEEIVSVADAYYLTLKYTKEDIDLSSTDAVQNNPVVRVLNKYLQDPEVCQIVGYE